MSPISQLLETSFVGSNMEQGETHRRASGAPSARHHGVRRKEDRPKEYNETDDSDTIEVVSVDFYVSVSCIVRNVNGECYCCDRFGVAVRCGDLAKALEWRDELRKQLERRKLEGNSAILSPRLWPPDRPQAAAISDQSASGSYTLSA